MAQRQHGAQPGDLIEFFRSIYQHWGVYVGKDEVIHLTSPGENDDQGSSSSGYIIGSSSSGIIAEVKRQNIWKVAGLSEFKVNNLLDHKYKPRDPDVIVKEACEMVGKRLPYYLTSANCEHFVTDLRYGRPESRQVVVAAVEATVAVLLLVIIVAAAIALTPKHSEEPKEQK